MSKAERYATQPVDWIFHRAHNGDPEAQMLIHSKMTEPGPNKYKEYSAQLRTATTFWAVVLFVPFLGVMIAVIVTHLYS